MARQRTPFYVDQLKELVNNHVTEMNKIITGANQITSKHANDRLGRLVDEALGVLELDVLVQEYLHLRARQVEVAEQFKRMVGESVALTEYLPENRVALINRLQRSDATIPKLIYEEMDLAGRRHGIEVAEVRHVPLLTAGSLMDELKACETKEEVLERLNRNQGKVLAMLGIRPEDLLKLMQRDALKKVETKGPDPNIVPSPNDPFFNFDGEDPDGNVPGGPGAA